MRNPHTAFAAAVVILLAAAPTVRAQSVEVGHEDGAHCGAITVIGHSSSGGCEITVVSTANMQTFNHTGATEAITSSCETEFTANINAVGTGYIDTTETTIHTNPAAGCPITVCEEAAPSHNELEWPIHGMDKAGTIEDVAITLCIRSVLQSEGQGAACTVSLDVAQNTSTHVLTLSATDEPCEENPASELSGAWQTTGTAELELTFPHWINWWLH